MWKTCKSLISGFLILWLLSLSCIFFIDTNVEFSAASSCSDRILMVWELLLKKFCISLSNPSLIFFIKKKLVRNKTQTQIKNVTSIVKWICKINFGNLYNLNLLPSLLRHILAILWFYDQSTFHSSKCSHRISLHCSCHKSKCKYSCVRSNQRNWMVLIYKSCGGSDDSGYNMFHRSKSCSLHKYCTVQILIHKIYRNDQHYIFLRHFVVKFVGFF